MIGARLGPYEISAKLGEGGMGEVYRATDTKLKRDVAIKVLPAAFTEDRERLARFEREAQLLAQLHHPNIASIYGLEESEGNRALVMELVEGPTLAERLEQGPLPFHESLSVSRQIAQALEEAHEKGIVHRDLKPQNVKAPVEGKVKVLDFGLAKAMDPAAAISGSGSTSHLAKSPTLTLGATVQGMILGTAAYMAPEQAKGVAVDKRADIWAFGVVFYEMLVGGSLFAGDSVGDTLAAVIRAEIDLDRLPAETPPAIRRLLRRCLERNPKNRLHDIADARIVLEEVIAGRHDEPARSAGSAVPPPAGARSRWLLAAGGLAVGVLLGGVAVRSWVGGASAARSAPALTQFEIRAPAKTSFLSALAISPDGRKIAFAARGENGRASLWVRSLDALEAREIPGTGDARLPFWAPDSRRIGYFSERSVRWIDSFGGAPMIVAPTAAVQEVRGATWGADDMILFAPTFSGPLQVAPASGGASAPATRIAAGSEFGTHRFPSFLPDGRRFVFYASLGSGTEPGVLHLGRLGSLDVKPLGPAHSAATFAAPGYLVYARGEALVAHRFDDAKEALVGEPVPLGIPMGGSLSVSGLRSLAVAQCGTLVYRSDRHGTTQLVWVDRAGRELEAISDADSAWQYAPRLSPDARFLLVARYTEGRGMGELWVHDLVRKLADRVTFDEGDHSMAIWAGPGGRELVFNSLQASSPGSLYRMALDRPGEGRVWLAHDTYQAPNAATPDGRRIVFERTDAQGRTSLWIRDLDGDGAAVSLGTSGSSELGGAVSPDGRWLAYMSDATRGWEVYVRRLDGSGGATRISSEGGLQPLWRRDGRELFYLDSSGRLVAVPFSGTDTAQPGRPAVLFEPRLEESNDRQYDAMPDGQRFVLNRSLSFESLPITVVLDWTPLLERKVP